MRSPTYRHSLYGDIPLIERNAVGRDGKLYTWHEYDPDYKPKLPTGAVPGDVAAQVLCRGHHIPRYFYVDEERTCRQCGESFTFTAKEQKFWYERLKFNYHSSAVRCPACRKTKRTEKALRAEMADLLRRLDESPEDPAALVELARATVQYRRRAGEGDLERAIGACRKARRLASAGEALFWEGVAQQLAGRPAKARAALKDFLGNAGNHHRYRALVREARSLLDVPAGEV